MNDYLINYIFNFQHPDETNDYSKIYKNKYYKLIENKRYRKYLANNLQNIIYNSDMYYSSIVIDSGSITIDEVKEYLYLRHYNTNDIEILYYYKENGFFNIKNIDIEMPYALIYLDYVFGNLNILIDMINITQSKRKNKYYKDYFYKYKGEQKNRLVYSLLDNEQIIELKEKGYYI